jgi:hypothetical protein
MSHLKVDVRRQPFLSHRALHGLLVSEMPANEFMPETGTGLAVVAFSASAMALTLGRAAVRLPWRS